jgi:hypothetical protein
MTTELMRSPSSSTRGHGCALGCILTGILGLVLVPVVASSIISNSIGGPAPHGVTPSVRWTQQTVVLGLAHPVVRGEVSVLVHEATHDPISTGVAVGVPSIAATPGATSGEPSPHPSMSATGVVPTSSAAKPLFVDPVVRVTLVEASGWKQTCLAPCELVPHGGAQCEAAVDCGVIGTITLELLAAGDRASGSIAVTVSAGATAPLGVQLPADVSADLTFDTGTLPSPGGG